MRRRPLAFALPLLLAAAAPAWAQVESITIDPPLPSSADDVTVIVEAVADCSLYFSHRAGTNIFIHNAHLCDPPFRHRFESRVEVGRLAPGTYTVLVEDGVAHDGSTIFATKVFTVAPDHAQDLRIVLSNRLPSEAERVTITVAGFSTSCPVAFGEPAISGRTIRLDGAMIVTILPCPPQEWSESVTLQPLPVGGYTVEVWIDGVFQLRDAFAVQPEQEVLVLYGEGFSFAATAAWKNPYGPGEGAGHPLHLTADSGAFWFFSPGNVEVTIKILDGRPVNGRWWVFIANMSTVEFTVDVTRCPTSPLLGLPCLSKSYRNPPLQNRNFLDTNAF